MAIIVRFSFRKITKSNAHQKNKYSALVTPDVLKTPNLNKVYVKLSINNKADEARTIAGIIDNKYELFFTLLGKREQ